MSPTSPAAVVAKPIEAKGIAFAFGDRAEANDDTLLLARLDREDARAQEAVSHPFDERRIAELAHDFLVHAARTLGIHRLTGHHLAVDREHELFERRALWQRQQEVGLADRPAVIRVGLRHFVPHDATIEFGAHTARGAHDLRRHGTSAVERPTIGVGHARSARTNRHVHPLGGGCVRNDDGQGDGQDGHESA